MLLEGLFLPLTTPFYADGRVYLRKLEHNAERYSRTLAAGLALLTPIGEPEMLSDAERAEVLRVAAAATAETTLLLADVSRPSVIETLRLAEVAFAARYDVALVRVPAGEESRQRVYLQAVADRSPLPMVIVEGEQTGTETALLAEMARHTNVIGGVLGECSPERVQALLQQTASIARDVTVTTVFEAVTGRMLDERAAPAGGAQYVSAEVLTGGTAIAAPPQRPAIKTRTRRVGFQLLAGSTRGALPLLRAGARGTLQPFSVCAPQACHEVLAAWKDDDQALAEEKFARVRLAAERIEQELGIAGLKAACDLTGYYGGRPRLPRVPLMGGEIHEVERLMRGMRS